MNNIIAYTRVSTDKQHTDNQRSHILDYAHRHGLHINKIIEKTISSRKSKSERLIDDTLDLLENKDTLLVYDLDRLGRSTLETLQIIEDIKLRGIKLVFTKTGVIIDNGNIDPMNEMMLTMLSGFAQLERSFISQRTKLGLARVKANGTILGRRKGQQVKSIFDPYKDKILELHNLGVPKNRIQEYIKVGTAQSLGKYMKTRNIVKKKAFRQRTNGSIEVDYNLCPTSSKKQDIIELIYVNKQRIQQHLTKLEDTVLNLEIFKNQDFKKWNYELSISENSIRITHSLDITEGYHQILITNPFKQNSYNTDEKSISKDSNLNHYGFDENSFKFLDDLT